MSRITMVNPLKSFDWNEMLISCGRGTIFHTANWARLLADSYGYHPVYFLWG